MKPATIKEIAERLEINPSTVSRALRGSSKVSEVTRRKVIQIADELNYTPNLWAQNLVGSASNIIGCLILELSNPFYEPVVRAIQELAVPKNIMVFIGESQRQLQTEKYLIDRFRRIRAAGVIVTPVMVEVDHLQRLEEEGVPVVILGRSIPGFFCVNVDNRLSGLLVGKHLINLGHREIGYIYSGEVYNTPEQHRLEGLKSALVESDLRLEYIYPAGRNDFSSGETAAQNWLNQSHRPSAVFCSNDMLAMGFIWHLLGSGVAVPGDVAVIGHDDVPYAGWFKVGLSTVAFPKAEVGRKAMDILLKRLERTGEFDKPANFVLEPRLVIRDSCGAVQT